MRYVPILKTRDAELRGIENLTENVKDAFTPLWELTKSRRTKQNLDGKIQRRLEKIHQIFGNRMFGLDLTSFIDLQNKEIHALFRQHNGFDAWVTFLKQQQETFDQIVPVLLMTDTDNKEQYLAIHNEEVRKISDSFDKYIYRVNLDYSDLKLDLGSIFKNQQIQPTALLDMEYIPKDRDNRYTQRAMEKLDILANAGIREIILAGCSFPKNPTDSGNDTTGEHRCTEIDIYNNCKKKFPNLIYGDYATIHPLPNERAGGQGWVPRIDFPFLDHDSISIRYYRDRKNQGEQSYALAYVRVAKKVSKDREFNNLKNKLGENNWGIRQIGMASEGYPPALNSAFWISVRINLYITLRQGTLR
jgi:hypothetical protein